MATAAPTNGKRPKLEDQPQPQPQQLEYLSGFGNHFATEAIPGALPQGQNTPQVCPLGLYAEQLSGTAFTAPREHNQRSWLYRIRPAVAQSRFVPMANPPPGLQQECSVLTPEQLRWGALPLPTEEQGGERVDWVHGLWRMAGAGDPGMKEGLAIYMYAANASMGASAFQNSDGDLLIVPQLGALRLKTELGVLEVAPHEIAVVPRGVRFNVALEEGPSRGYVLEVYKGHFRLPSLGPIGANGLANPRDFKYPVAAYEDDDTPFRLTNKFSGQLFEARLPASPFNVVAWHGNYAPFKYCLDDFCTVNSVSFDHLDPSIYTVLTCASDEPGTAVADFVIFPPRWMVMERTFRPPYYHRNVMAEFMGMVYGKYDAKAGFVPGGASLHSCMSPHGPDADTFIKASEEQLQPTKFDAGLAFMFETCYTLRLSPWATQAPHLEVGYVEDCWARLPKRFTGGKKKDEAMSATAREMQEDDSGGEDEAKKAAMARAMLEDDWGKE